MAFGTSTRLSFDLLTKYNGTGAKQAERDLKGLGRTTDSVGGKFGSFSRTAMAALAGAGTAAAAGLGKAIFAAKDFDKTMRMVGVQTKTAGKSLDELRQLALKMGDDTVFSAKDASAAMVELAKSGFTAAQIKGGALAGTMKLAAAGELNMASAATYLGNSLSMFGMKAKDADKVVTALAGGANASSASVESLGLALSQVGPGAKLAGLSIQETVAALSAFDAMGLKGSDAGTSLKTMLMRLVPQTTKAKGAMRDLGLSFTTAKGEILPLREIAERLQESLKGVSAETRTSALSAIFGSDAYRAAALMAKLGAEGVDRYTKAAKDSAAAQKLANVGMKGASGAWENFTGSIETLSIKIGSKLLPAFTSAINFLDTRVLGVMDGVINAFSTLVGWVKQNSTVLTILGATIAGALVPYAAYKTVILGIAKAQKIMAATQLALNIVMRANPIGLVITAIAALAAGLIAAYKKSETFRKIVDGAFSAIAKAGKWLWEKVLRPAFTAIGKAFKAVGSAFMSVWNNLIAPVFRFLVDKFTWVVGSILDGAAKMFGWVPGIGDKLRSAADKFNAFRDRVNNALDGVRDRTVNITTRAQIPAGVSVRQLMERGMATGGMVRGPGGPRDDKIPARLSNGEFVVNAAATKRNRGLLEAINSRRFADGGLVSVRAQTDGTRELGAFARQFNSGLGWMAKTMGKGLLEALKSAVPSVSGVPTSVSGNAAVVKSIFANMFGWGRYWPQTYSLLMKESGFRNTAQNPTSSAYGMFQFLDSTWGGYGIPKTSDPRLQSIAGGRYIRARYGNPANALAFHLRNNWYDKGGILKSGGIAGNKSGKPERILSPRQTNAFERLVDALTGGLKQSDAPLSKQLKNLHRTITDIAKLLHKADRHRTAERVGQGFRRRIARLLVRRERLDERLEKAREKRDRIVNRRREVAGGLRGGIMEGRNLVGGFGIDIDGTFSAGDIAKQLKVNLGNAKKFQGLLRKMRKMGFSTGIIAQVAQAGPAEGMATAEALMQAQSGQVSDINKSFGGIGKAAGAFSKEIGKKLYGASQKAAQGLVDGLREKRDRVQRIMTRLGRMMARILRRALHRIETFPERMAKKAEQMEKRLEAKKAKSGSLDGSSKSARRRAVRRVSLDQKSGGDVHIHVHGARDVDDFVRRLRHELKTNRTLRRELGLAK